MIDLLFGTLILCLICYLIFKFLPDPARTVGLVLVCLLAILFVWQHLGSLGLHGV